MEADSYIRRVAKNLSRSIARLEKAREKATQPLSTSQRRSIRTARKSYIGNLRRIRSHRSNSRSDSVRRACTTVLESFSAKLISVIAAADAKGKNLSLSELIALAEKIDFKKPCKEPALISAMAKSTGGFRVIQAFGVEATARQMIGRDLLVASTSGNGYEFNSVGRGRESLQKNILHSMEDGYTYWIEADIKSFFASLKPPHFKTLPLPAYLKEHTLSCTTEKLIPKQEQTIPAVELIQAAQSGLPEGAASSPFLASAFLGRELRAFMSKALIRLYCYVDNLIIGARSKEELETFAEALSEHFRMLETGPLDILLGQIQRLDDQVVLLGWSFRSTTEALLESITVTPSEKSFERFILRLYDKLQDTSSDQMPQRAFDYAKSFCAAHFWTPLEHEFTDLLCLAKDVIETVQAERHLGSPKIKS